MFFLWTLLPALLFAISNLLQKVGLDKAQTQVNGSGAWANVKSVLQNLAWWAGIGLAFFGTLGYYGALARYNISLVQPIMALNPVLTAIGGWWLLKEHLDRKTVLAISLVVLGLSFAGALHGESAGKESSPALWIFGALLLTLVILLQLFLKHTETRQSAIAGIHFGLSAVFMKSMETIISAGGGFDWSDPLNPQVWTRGIAYVGTYLWAFFSMQIALAKGRSLLVVPLVSAVGMLVPSLAGILVFQEPAGAPKIAALFFVLLGSLLFMKTRSSDANHP